MPREMFTSAPPLTPRRSKWTIAGSVVIHFAFVLALLIIPVLSAFDSFVVSANNSLKFIVPAVAVMPVIPPPKSQPQQLASDINVNAAPTSAPEKPVTHEVTPPLPGQFIVGNGPTGPGAGGPPGFGPPGLGNFLGTPPPATTAASSGPVRPGGDIKFPTRLYAPAPTYPSLARSARIEGTVYLEATIDVNGNVRDVTVLKSIPFLDEAAKAAVSQWKYTPTKLNGVAVPVILTVTVTFTLK